MGRIGLAIRCFFSILFQGALPSDIARQLVKAEDVTSGTKSTSEAPPKQKELESFDRSVQMLALLQRDGRLVDFLAENISAYPDVQLGAAVRAIHTNCQQVLERYMKLEPILNSEEDQPVTVPGGFDPGSIKLLGNVTGKAPVQGLLRHRGWRVKEIHLPPLAQPADRMVIAPAEVELS